MIKCIVEDEVSKGYLELLVEYETDNADIPVLDVKTNAPIALRLITILSIIISSWLLLTLFNLKKTDLKERNEPWPVIDYFTNRKKIKLFEKALRFWTLIIFSFLELVSYLAPLLIGILCFIESKHSDPSQKVSADIIAGWLLIFSIIPTIGNLVYYFKILKKDW